MTQTPVSMAVHASRDMASTNAFAGKNSKEKCVKVRLTVRVLNFLLPKAVDDF